MKKITAIVTALGAALIGLAFLAPAAQAYPEAAVTVTVNRSTLASGQLLVVKSRADVTCVWTVDFAGVTKHAEGTRLNERFTAPPVDKPTVFPVTVTCTYGSASGAGAAAIKIADVTRTVNVTVVPPRAQGAPAANQGSALPNTGGPNAWLLAGGGLLVLAGAGAVVVGRRRASAS